MRLRQVLTAGAFLASLTLGGPPPSFAQTDGAAEDPAGPAELPPPDFGGRQYVDSRGCVFARVSVDGEVRWVPLMTAAREPVCGKKPTFALAAPEPETTAPEEPAVTAAETAAKDGMEESATLVAEEPEEAESSGATEEAESATAAEEAPSDTEAPEQAAATEEPPAPPEPAPAPMPAEVYYVQVGLFGVSTNATRAAEMLSAAGLPAEIRDRPRRSKVFRLVLAGPFATRQEAAAALRTARRIGFPDAYLRKEKR